MDPGNVFILFLTIGFFALIAYLAIASHRRPQRTKVAPEKKKDDVRRAA